MANIRVEATDYTDYYIPCFLYFMLLLCYATRKCTVLVNADKYFRQTGVLKM